MACFLYAYKHKFNKVWYIEIIFVTLQPIKLTKYMRRLTIAFLLTIFAVATYAVPATPLPTNIVLADGTTIEVYLRGDEYASYYTLQDGTPIRIENGVVIHDVTLPEKALQKRRAARQTNVQASSFPTTGSPKGLVILVNFADKKFIKTREEFSNMLNQSGYAENNAIGSVRDYFIASSDSTFQPIFDVYGPYDLPNPMKYYGEALSDDVHDVNAEAMIMHACAAAFSDSVDFSQYDVDDDGKIDNVFVYYAGHNQAEHAPSETIWPHRSSISSQPSYGGKRLYDYACSSELKGKSGKTMCGIGTFCHEFSHVLGLSDMYDTQTDKETTGAWDLMTSGNYNGDGRRPPTYTAFERYSMGWLEPIVLSEAGQYLLQPMVSHHTAYLIPVSTGTIEPNTNGEYFLIENRQPVGWESYSGCIPGHGMLVWHVNYKSGLWASNTPNSGNNLSCFIECASGENRTHGSSSDLFPGYTGKTMFMPKSIAGVDLQKPLLNIQEVGEDVVFVFIRDGNKHLSFTPATLLELNSEYTTYSNGSVERDMPAQRIALEGASLDPAEDVIMKTSDSNFQFSCDSISWVSSLVLRPAPDSSLQASLFMRYRPTMQTCEYEEGNIQAQQGAAIAILQLKGKAPRQVLITPPIAKQTKNITPYSAELQWASVTDATHYYLTMYQFKEGETEFTQDFEYFDSPTAVAQAGWQTNFNTLSSLMKESGYYSLWFKNFTDTAVTEEYALPITDIRFWYGVPTTDADTVGELNIEAYNGTEWQLLDNVTVKKRDRKKTYEKTFDTASYIKFRITFLPSNDESVGVCIDNFTATCNKMIDYLYRDEEKTIVAVEGEDIVTCYIDGLLPNEEYFYKVRVSDKGHEPCEEHIKEMLEPQSVMTLDGKIGEQDLTYVLEGLQYNAPKRVIYLPEADGERTLYFYDVMGQLVAYVPVPAQQNRVEIPQDGFVKGNVYIVKYSLVDKIKRKDRWIKILY